MIRNPSFIIERRAIPARHRDAKIKTISLQRKTIPSTGRLAHEISRALRMAPLRFPRSWLMDY